ncbi:MAG TPA: peptide chain release factor N(5)-glutamine methyltransferase [Longimicrobiales bacterium]
MADTPLALARAAAAYMAERGVENARLEAELLLASVLGLSRLELYLQHDRPVTEREKAAFRVLVRRRVKREPLQYILGEAEFRELRLRVDPRVLIPRPETEVLVGEVLRWARSAGAGLTAVDIGTGSGAIALSLAKEGPFAHVVATDVSRDALDVARENARRLGLTDRVEFRHGVLWEALRPGERFDVVVSNPPYVAESERAALPPEVAEWEPAQALFAPGDGLDVIAALVDGAPDRLRPGGLLALEIGLGQAGAVTERIEHRGAYGPPRVVKDLAGRERIVLAEARPLA